MRRVLGLFTLILLAVSPLAAGEPSPSADEVLRRVLDLNEQQLGVLRSLLEARRTALSDAAQRAGALRAQLEEALGQPKPEPATVGTLLIGIRVVERQAAQHQETFRRIFLETLTDEQRQRTETMRFIRASYLGGAALEELGL